MQAKHEVVITGVGIVSPLGSGCDDVWNKLLGCENGVKALGTDYEGVLKNDIHVAGLCEEVSFQEFDFLDSRKRKNIGKLNKATQMAIYCGLKALKDAKLKVPDDCNKYRIGSILGAGSALADRYEGQKVEERNPKWFLETYPNLLNGYLSLYASLNGYGSTIVNACVGGTQALGEAFKKIQHGEEQIMLAGGVDDKVSSTYASGFDRLRMSSKQRNPDEACRPFDEQRDGLVLSQGACCFILESLESARERGAQVKGRIVGYGNSMDAESIIGTSAKGKTMAMQCALKDAGIRAEDIGYINAHGTSTANNDLEECLAIRNVFGEYAHKIPISSTKSMMGHTFAACGAIQGFVCMKSLQEQIVHANRNFKNCSQQMELDYVKDKCRKVDMEYCISNTSGLGGFNSTLVFQRI